MKKSLYVAWAGFRNEIDKLIFLNDFLQVVANTESCTSIIHFSSAIVSYAS